MKQFFGNAKEFIGKIVEKASFGELIVLGGFAIICISALTLVVWSIGLLGTAYVEAGLHHSLVDVVAGHIVGGPIGGALIAAIGLFVTEAE